MSNKSKHRISKTCAWWIADAFTRTCHSDILQITVILLLFIELLLVNSSYMQSLQMVNSWQPTD